MDCPAGQFEEEFLAVPAECLILTMRQNQKYFPLVKAGKLTNRFLIVSNLRLADPWRLEVQGSHLIVHAPLLRASLPPAIHTDEMEAHTERGWCRCAPEDLLRELHREVTPLISHWASNEQHLGLVRETARLQVAEFLRRWLEGETRWGPRSFTAISVRLGGEALPPPEPTRSLFLTAA